MKRKNPPAIARWILEHLVPGKKNDALSGDLLEEFRCGRSSLWYWRQVLAAFVVGCMGVLRASWLAFVFAFLWAIPASAFWIAVIRWQSGTFLNRRWDFPWPYSMICELALTFGWQVLYVWGGVIFGFSIFSAAKKQFIVIRLARGVWISLAAYLVTFVALFVWRLLYPMPFDVRYVTPAGLTISLSMISFRMSFFIAVVAGLWSACVSADQKKIRTVA
jgi:hypothetical protein